MSRFSKQLTSGLLLASALLSLAAGASAQESRDSKPQETLIINKVMGGIEGINNQTFEGGDGTGIGMVTLKVIMLQLHKESYGLTADGKMAEKALPQDAKVVLGQVVYFTLYVDNLTEAELYKINMVDKIDEQSFAYMPNSLEMAVTDANTPAKEEDFDVKLTDRADGDIAFIADTPDSANGKDLIVVGETKDQRNGVVSVAPGKRLTVRFKVQIQ